MPDKPWLGAQEAHYASLLWHLDVPEDYTSQIDATRSVFPGKAMVNITSTPANHAKVQIKGFAKAWITDMECATSLRPKMYGFDFARVTEVFKKLGERRLIVEEEQDKRINHSGLPGERTMMKDLMLSTMREGGEVSMTYHMLNPFFEAASEVTGDKIGNMLGFATGETINDLFMGPITTVADNALKTIEHNAQLLGAFLDEVLASPHSNGKNIWLRLLHEPNINHFWWGHPKTGPVGAFYENYAKLWNTIVKKIHAAMDETRTSRLKLVFCINGEPNTATLETKLTNYFPTTMPTGAFATEYNEFINSIDIFGLDYYEDWATEWSRSGLPAQYQAIVDKTNAMNTDFGVSWEHALTEVSIRTVGKFKGKIYGEYDGVPAWPRRPDISGLNSLNRRFFEKVVYKLVKDHQPKWVLFWINRVGNSILNSFEPTTGQAENGTPPMFYDHRTNVFTSHYVEHFFPIFPAEPFVVDTFKAGDDSGTKTFFPISQTEQVPNLPGANASGALNIHVEPYKDAILDFFQMVPPERRAGNVTSCTRVAGYLCDPTLPRPTINPSPTPEERDELLFEVL